MKNIFKTLIPCLVLAFGVTSCYDEMEDKSSIDSQYEKASNVTVSLGEVSVVSFSEIAANVSVSDTIGVLEVGVMVSNTQDFSSYTAYAEENLALSFKKAITGLSEETTYYVRAYAYTVAGGTVVSEPVSVNTPAAPIFDLNGTYTCVEYDESGTLNGSYKVAIAFVAGSTTEVEITNIWEGGMTVSGTFDPATGKLTIPANQVILVHPSYGDVWIEAEDGVALVGQFTAKGGFLNTGVFGAVCSAGYFGYQYLKMTHD
ncbi:MAG: hypothetical protein E7085_00165 [Parabacteroides distasonis]|nr:hypothetical protein [Parabacteroides distasonis]